MRQNTDFPCKRSNLQETAESKSFRVEKKICLCYTTASNSMTDICLKSNRGIDFYRLTVFDYIVCCDNQGHTYCVSFHWTTGKEFFLKDSKRNLGRFKPTQKVTEKRPDGEPDKIGHLLQTASFSQIISIVLVPTMKGIATKDLEIHFDTDLVIADEATMANSRQVYYLCLEQSAEHIFLQVGLAVQALQIVEADTKLEKLDFLLERKLRQLFDVNSSVRCPLQQLKTFFGNSSSKSGYLNVIRPSNNKGRHFCHQTEMDAKCKCKARSQKPIVDEREIHCASPLQGVCQQSDKEGEKMSERICAQHDSREKSKKPHSMDMFDEKQRRGQLAQPPSEPEPSVHNKVAVGNDQDFMHGEQEQSSTIQMHINLTAKSQELLERQSGHHLDINTAERDWQGACGIEGLIRIRQAPLPSPPQQTQSLPPLNRMELRRRMKHRNFRVASMLHLLQRDQVKNMADAGLYLDEVAGLFCCPHCGLQVRQSQWPWEQRPQDVHRRQSPDCPAVNPGPHTGHTSPVTERGNVLHISTGEQRDEKEKEREESTGASTSVGDGEDKTVHVASGREHEGQAHTTSIEEKIKGQTHDTRDKTESLFSASVEELDDELENDPVYIPKILDNVPIVIPSNSDLQADCIDESSASSNPSTDPDNLF